MSSTSPTRSLWTRLKLLLGRSSTPAAGRPPRTARFQLLYERFREILALNDAALQLIADMDEMRARRASDALEALAPRIRRVAMDVFLMAKNLNQIADGRYLELYQVLKGIDAHIEAELSKQDAPATGPPILRLDAVRLDDAPLAGAKMAVLGELRASGRWSVPDGFVVTTSAFAQFMTEAELWDRAERLESMMVTHGPASLAEGCREVRQAILRAPVPSAIAKALLEAYDHIARGELLEVAMRSSAVGEDTSLSHAGQYHTELHVNRERLLDAYRMVVASAYGASAVSYRLAHGLTAREARMAVGCMRMLSPRASGVLFSRAFEQPRRDVVVISATKGIAAGIVAGTQAAEELRVAEGQLAAPSSLLSEAECLDLARLARELESWRGQPQDIEWAIEPRGELFVLQARPLSTPLEEVAPVAELTTGEAPIATGGRMAYPGAAAGPVTSVRSEDDLDRFPAGAVLVARHSSPAFARVMERCVAIVTEVGSPSGHMAILAREYQVPAIVGLPRALELLAAGSVVTVDATSRRVFAGRLDLPASARPARAHPDSPALQTLSRLAALVTPLHLTDPASPEFVAASCRSLHDVTRFVHEKVFEVMFHFGDLASSDQNNAVTLEAHLPLHVLLYDVGGGLSEAAASTGRARVEDVLSVPGQAFLSGLSDPRIRWDEPRPLSGRGFLSVLGDGIAAPPPRAREVGRRSYAVLSDRYMNFSTKAGYHFSTVDTYCGASLSKNYVHFRFERGGAAGARRARRVQFLSTVLRALDFTAQTRGDLLVARLEKYDRETIRVRLADLGRLTLCARQLDMLMDDDRSVEFYARAFLAGDFSAF
jgi:pyruvate,water dikinase